MLQKLEQPLVVNRVKEAFDIGIQYPVHSFAGNRHTQRIERIVLAATSPKAVAETEKILLIDALQDPKHRLLDNFVLKRSDAQRSLPTVRLGDPDSTRRLSTVGSPVNSIMEVRNTDLQIPLIFEPGYTVDSNCRRPLQVEESFGQTVFVDVMQQGREFERAAGAGSFAHAVQSE